MDLPPATSAAPASGTRLLEEAQLFGIAAAHRSLRGLLTGERVLQAVLFLPMFVLGCGLVIIPAIGLSAGLAHAADNPMVLAACGVPVALFATLSLFGQRREHERLERLQREG